MKYFNPLTAIDFYKTAHVRMYPEGTTMVYSNFTPRSNKHSNLPDNNDHIVFFGLQYFIKYFLIEVFNDNFFSKPKEEVLNAYKRRLDTSLGKNSVDIEHIAKLHDLGYLPLEIRALPEGTKVRMGVPCLTVHNTHPDFFWLTNYIETIMSSILWKPCTSATTANWYKNEISEYAKATGSDLGFVQFQGHDFSYRGMSGPMDAALSGAAHLLSFVGTDSVTAIDLLEQYYNADCEKELVGCSVPASEHSTMCMGSKENEIDTFKRYINELYPSGIVSIVSDTWDLWDVVTKYASELKEDILKRNGKVVFRPDSGYPPDIICGKATSEFEPEQKGVVECLWDIFGGTVNEKGYKELDSHVGVIYGDSITPKICLEILERLKQKGFASSNIVFGIGSGTYQGGII